MSVVTEANTEPKQIHGESFALNRARWDEVVAIHVASPFYRVKEFLAGADILLPIERREIGDLGGKSLIHLQCHFGLDTLALARRGANVTGLDFSTKAIAAARDLAREAGIDARFVEGNVYDAPALVTERFDVAYVSWGAINWLPDIRGWARVVAAMLKPGGELYLLEGHPFALTLDQLGSETIAADGAIGQSDPAAALRPAFPYFRETGRPLVFEMEQTYTGDGPKLVHTRTHEFVHGIGDILGALLEAGLTLTMFREHDACAWAMWPLLVEGEDRMFRLPAGAPSLPLSFSLRARLD
ncbi:methyltransferase family protein [Dongia mobilis]|uniref:Methyltransferase family protein n=1 Tax=Dongia mobilis TaxID=578943 RepID=A0A4R6WSC7_9PROT|nr:methyltransferase family protein [Dongia mobilis]